MFYRDRVNALIRQLCAEGEMAVRAGKLERAARMLRAARDLHEDRIGLHQAAMEIRWP